MKDTKVNQTITFRSEPARAVVYCKKCGKPILFSYTSEDGSATDPKWEIDNRLHSSCYTKVMAEIQKAQEIQKANDPEVQRLAEPIDEDIMAKYARKEPTE